MKIMFSDLMGLKENNNYITYLFYSTPWNIHTGEIEKNHKQGFSKDHKLEDTDSLLHFVDVWVMLHYAHSVHLSAVESHTVISLETKLRMWLPWLLFAANHTPGYEYLPWFKSIQPRQVGRVLNENVRERWKE